MYTLKGNGGDIGLADLLHLHALTELFKVLDTKSYLYIIYITLAG